MSTYNERSASLAKPSNSWFCSKCGQRNPSQKCGSNEAKDSVQPVKQKAITSSKFRGPGPVDMVKVPTVEARRKKREIEKAGGQIASVVQHGPETLIYHTRIADGAITLSNQEARALLHI